MEWECPEGTTVTPGYTIGHDQPGPITLSFENVANEVRTVYVEGYGEFLCSGSYGTLTAYAKNSGAELASVPIMHDVSSSDSTPEWLLPCGRSTDTYWVAVALLTTTEPIGRVVITPMSPLTYVHEDGSGGAARLNYEIRVDQAYPPLPTITFDRHVTDTIPPSVYPFAAGSACSRAATSDTRYPWGFSMRRYDASPVANRAVQVTLGWAFDTSGHHLAHAFDRPVGSFFPAGTVYPAAAAVTSITVTTDAQGHASFDYYPPEFGGTYTLLAEAGVATYDTITVGYRLKPVPGKGVDWLAYGELRNYHSDVYFAAPTMRAQAVALAQAYAERFPGKHLYFNDMGLPLGGRFDIHGQWAADEDHCSHRYGNALDLRTNVLPALEFEFVRWKWNKLTGIAAPFYHRGHYHLQLKKEV